MTLFPDTHGVSGNSAPCTFKQSLIQDSQRRSLGVDVRARSTEVDALPRNGTIAGGLHQEIFFYLRLVCVDQRIYFLPLSHASKFVFTEGAHGVFNALNYFSGQ